MAFSPSTTRPAFKVVEALLDLFAGARLPGQLLLEETKACADRLADRGVVPRGDESLEELLLLWRESHVHTSRLTSRVPSWRGRWWGRGKRRMAGAAVAIAASQDVP